MELDAVKTSYARWARIYDQSFGAVTTAGRRRAVEVINQEPGHVLELGVGTGLSLERFAPQVTVTGIDYSEEMLGKARDKVARMGLTNIAELCQMDARELDFPDAHFDAVAAMHVLSVVPEPETVMSEIARVLRPGGRVVITNHFMRETGVLAQVERLTAPLANTLGWHPDFPVETVLKERSLVEEHRRPLPPFGMMTLLVLRKTGAS